MHLREWATGRVYSIWVVDLSDDPNAPDCPALDFLEELAKSAKRQRDSLIAVMELHMESGSIGNTRKSRDLRDGIREFKEPKGARLLYFYLPGWRTVVTHGFKKGAKLSAEIKRALVIKKQFD